LPLIRWKPRLGCLDGHRGKQIRKLTGDKRKGEILAIAAASGVKGRRAGTDYSGLGRVKRRNDQAGAQVSTP